jgi:hypothetical protein
MNVTSCASRKEHYRKRTVSKAKNPKLVFATRPQHDTRVTMSSLRAKISPGHKPSATVRRQRKVNETENVCSS